MVAPRTPKQVFDAMAENGRRLLAVAAPFPATQALGNAANSAANKQSTSLGGKIGGIGIGAKTAKANSAPSGGTGAGALLGGKPSSVGGIMGVLPKPTGVSGKNTGPGPRRTPESRPTITPVKQIDPPRVITENGPPNPPIPTAAAATTSDVSSAAIAAIPRQSLIPGRDVINFQTAPTSPEAMQQILFEEIAGYELVNISRRDTIEGLSDVYTLISNLSSIRREYNPSQLISLQRPNFTGFETYQIDLNSYIPGDVSLQEKNITSFYYIASNGDLVIELDNLQDDDEIEVQMANSGKIT